MYNIIIKGNVEQHTYKPVCDALRSIIDDRLSIGLEIRHLKDIIIPLPTDFTNEVLSFQRYKQTQVGCTDDENYYASAKVVSYTENNSLSSTIFLQLKTLINLFQEQTHNEALNTVHHELCHVHDDYFKSKIFGLDFITLDCEDFFLDLPMTLRLHAEGIWSEYFACRKSATTLHSEYHSDMLKNLIDITKDEIDENILAYRFNGDIDYLYRKVAYNCSRLLIMCGRALGDLHGLKKNVINLSPEIQNSYLSPILYRLAEELDSLYNSYPNWKSGFEVLRGLESLVKELWNISGIFASVDNDGNLNIDVPFR